MIKLDEASHVYTDQTGRVVPGVTTILTPVVDYSGVPKKMLEAARMRGDYVHKACEMFLWGLLDESDIPLLYLPYITGFKLFLSETGFQSELVEQLVYHPTMGYAGTLDLAGHFLQRKKEVRALIDIKTTFRLMDSTGPQTWAYREAHAAKVGKENAYKHRYGLRLTREGKYQLKAYNDDMTDGNIFRSCLAIHNFINKGKQQ